MSGFKMDDYVDVAERLRLFKAEYPDGSLSSTLEPLRDRDGGVINAWLCRAEAYRTPDDPRPGVGHAVEPVPGKTPYTRDSEAMNAETSAWGRAIIALGFPTKKIASADEVRNRQEDRVVEPEGLKPPTSWPKLEEMIGAYDQTFHDLFGEFVKACGRRLFGPEIDIKKLSASDKKLLLQKAAGAALHVREQFEPSAFPPPGIEDIRAGFASVLQGEELGIPEEQHQLDAEALAAAERDVT
jgi:hypothetical protein